MGKKKIKQKRNKSNKHKTNAIYRIDISLPSGIHIHFLVLYVRTNPVVYFLFMKVFIFCSWFHDLSYEEWVCCAPLLSRGTEA
ncbi:hypothetical protein BDV23DRAFT_143516 [Aspergillus alliaceus]|uniref:Uncharacterized protein n=1 Tax=Petromyces alliaceus TaxID=209559 RepID=A0A5N7CS44_PETAA|nr:uncharacterized protein BDW43DRAFT_275571 [Aspergillus alliaceus]KAB8233596.1 hypothetical protein BDW43DRAFT_275571 [Aspergillus alliaceus]KAE8396739.1 hypothetical protein BDV23DRAFT_143516 [Aspergillus alliaceus]